MNPERLKEIQKQHEAEREAIENGDRDDDQYPIDYEPRKIKRPPKKVLIRVGIREHYPGRFRLSGRWDSKRFYFYKGADRKSIKSYGEAVFWKAKIETDAEKGEFDPANWGRNLFQFDDAIETWAKGNVSESEYKQNQLWTIRKFLIPYFKQKDFRTITDTDVTSFYRHLRGLTYLTPSKQRKSYSDKRVKDVMGELKSFLLSQRHHFKKFPDFPRIKVQLPDIKWLDAKQQDQVFKFLAKEDLPIFRFMRYTGCRPNEAAGMLRQNVDKAKNEFTIATAMVPGGKVRASTKTKVSRPLPIIAELKDCFNYKGDSKFVFTTPQGRPYSVKMIASRWEQASSQAHKKYGTPQVSLYPGTKHSFGMQRLAQGFSLDEIRAVMGHTSSRTTERYARYLTSNLKNVMSGVAPNTPNIYPDINPRNLKQNMLGGKDSNLG